MYNNYISVIDYSFPYFISYLTGLHYDHPKEKKVNIWVFVNIFASEVWLVTLLCMIVLAFAFKIYSNIIEGQGGSSIFASLCLLFATPLVTEKNPEVVKNTFLLFTVERTNICCYSPVSPPPGSW